MDACIILCLNSKPDQHKNKILFIDALDKVTRKNAESYLEPEHIKEIVKIYNEYTDLQGIACVVEKETIKLNDNTLTIQMYVVASQNRVYSLKESLDAYYEFSESMHNSYDELYKIFAR